MYFRCRLCSLGKRQLKEALNGKALAVMNSKSEITLVAIKEDGSRGDEVTSEMTKNCLQLIELGGHRGNILLSLDTVRKKLVLWKIKDNLTIEVVRRSKLNSSINRGDKIDSMAISTCGEFVFVHTYTKSMKASKQLMMSVNGNEIKLCATLDLFSKGLMYFRSSLVYLKTVGDDLIFKAMSWMGFEKMLTLVYNKRTGEFTELKAHRKILGETIVLNLSRQGDVLYGIGYEPPNLIKII